MIIYDLAMIEDRGTYYQVIGLTKNTFDVMADSDQKYIKLSSAAYDVIAAAIRDGRGVRLPKTMISNEVLPGEVNVIDPDSDELSAAKQAAILRANSLASLNFAKTSGIVYYNFIVLNNELIDAGYVITDKNRDQKYIEIIETDDDALISKLEEYLTARDNIERSASLKRRLESFTADVNGADTVEDVERIRDRFLENVYSTST